MNINKELLINNNSVKLRLDFQLEDFHLDITIDNKTKINWSLLFDKNGYFNVIIAESESVIGFTRDDNILKINVLFNKKNYVSYSVKFSYIENEIRELDKWFKEHMN
jgi:hypothetical protein